VEVTERFADLMAQPVADIPLDRAALLIAAHARPGLDIGVELRRLDDLASGCPAPDLGAITRYLFTDLGFAGNTTAYHDPRNSYLDQVMARRLGIPITLSVLAIAVGRRLEVPLAGVAMPGHFLLRDEADPRVFVDAFGGGARLDGADCRAMFRTLHGPGVAFADDYLDPVGTDVVLARMLANLRSVFISLGDRSSLVWVLRLRTVLPGSPAEDRADLAAGLASLGRFDAAAVEFDLAADIGRDSSDDGLGGGLSDEWRRTALRLRARLN
jgi:regulator of sirC expression with transglutaminase-like and TPR domain